MAKPKIKVTDKDLGEKRLRKQLANMSKLYARAGVLGSEAPRKNMGEKGAFAKGTKPITNIELALVHEFGTRDKRIPARSFIRASFDAHRKEYLRELFTAFRGPVTAGKMSVRRALSIVGLRMARDMKNRISKGLIAPKLADSTVEKKLAFSRGKRRTKKIRRKTANRPLLDTGQLKNSISNDVAGGNASAGGWIIKSTSGMGTASDQTPGDGE